jgi:cell division transport system permease protein
VSWRRLDIPLDRDGSARFLPWLVALMVYLSALALAGALVLGDVLARWDQSLAGTATVELPPAPADPAQGDGGMAAALALLRATPGVLAAEPLDRAATAKLLEPWLGTAASAEDLALPRLVDVRMAPGARLDGEALAAKLRAAAPGATLDDHRLWLDRLADFARSVELTALLVILVIAAAAVLTVVFTTRTGLAVHHEVIEVLHLIGARDGYIARQFEREALRLGLLGGAAGLALALLTLLALGHAAAATALLGDEVRLLPSLRLEAWQWASLCLIPAGAALVAMATARLTVLRALARMP